jgi:hypothetical protein
VGLSLAINLYAKWIALGTIIVAVGAMLYALVIQKISLKQVVATVTVVKEKLSDEAKEHFFGNGDAINEGLVKHTIQSPTTTAIVKDILKKEEK